MLDCLGLGRQGLKGGTDENGAGAALAFGEGGAIRLADVILRDLPDHALQGVIGGGDGRGRG